MITFCCDDRLGTIACICVSLLFSFCPQLPLVLLVCMYMSRQIIHDLMSDIVTFLRVAVVADQLHLHNAAKQKPPGCHGAQRQQDCDAFASWPITRWTRPAASSCIFGSVIFGANDAAATATKRQGAASGGGSSTATSFAKSHDRTVAIQE